jgi:DNA-binding NtrC family response regulator
VEQFTRNILPIPDDQMKRMVEYSWPGNVRELRNVIERACLLRQDRTLRPADILGSGHSNEESRMPAGHSNPTGDRILTLDEIVRNHISSTIKACDGNKSKAARVLGISLSTLKRRLSKMNQLQPGQNDPNSSY